MSKLRNKIINRAGDFLLRKKLRGKRPENIIFIEPNYYILDTLDSSSVIFDIGTGNDANLSQDLIRKFGLKSYGFDPTIRHQASLKQVESESGGKFAIYEYALSDKTGEAEFYESGDNISGSFSTDHVNIKKDSITAYRVKTASLENIFSIASVKSADLVKIDIEGEEYKVIASLTQEIADRVGQFIFEFHHHCIDQYSILDNLKAIRKITSLGYRHYSEDGINYLFYK